MRLAFHPDRQESVRFLPEPCRNRNAGKVHGTVKKVKTDAIYPASVRRVLNVLLRELQGEVRENVEESFQKRPHDTDNAHEGTPGSAPVSELDLLTFGGERWAFSSEIARIR